MWIDGGRFEGNARVAGRFRLEPIRAVDVGPAEVHVREGRVTFGRSAVIAESVTGTAALTIERFDPRFVLGASIFRHVSLRTDLAGRLADPSRLPFALPGGMYVSTEVDARRLALAVDRGVLVGGTRIDLGTKRAIASKDGTIGYASVELYADVASDRGRDRLQATLAVADVALVRADAAPVLHAPRLTVTAEARELDLALSPLRDAHLVVELPDVELPDARIIDRFLPERAPLAFAGGSARANARVEIFPGEGRATGRANVVADALDLHLPKVHLAGSFAVSLSCGSYEWASNEVKDAKVAVVVSAATLASARAPAKPNVEAKNIYVDVDAKTIALAAPLRQLEARLHVPEARLRDATMLVPDPSMKEIRRARAIVAVEGRLKVDDHVASGELRARSSRVAIDLGPVRVHAAVDARAKVRDWRWERGELALDQASVDVTRVKISRPDDARALASVDRVRLAAKSRRLSLSDPLARVDARLGIDGAEIPDVRALQGLVPTGEALRIASGRARASGALAISSSTRTGSGAMSVDLLGGRVVLGETSLSGDVSVTAKIASFDPETSTIDLSGSRIAMRDVAVQEAAAETTGWRGELSLETGTLRFEEAPAVDAIVRLDADDARPLLGVVFRDSMPKVVADLVEMPRLDALARLHVSSRSVALSDLSANGGDVAIRGSYALTGDQHRGAFVVEKGPFSVGLQLGDDGASPRLFNLDPWLGAEEKAVKAKAREPGAPEP